MEWARKIRDLRHFEGLKQDALAQQLGVSQASVSQWERGVAEPPPEAQSKLTKRIEATPTAALLSALRISVYLSPNVALLLVRKPAGIVLDLMSECTPDLTQFLKQEDLGQVLNGRFGPVADEQLATLVQKGLFDGRLPAAVAVTRLYRDGRTRPVYVSLAAFRDVGVGFMVRAEVRIPDRPIEELDAIEPFLRPVTKALLA